MRRSKRVTRTWPRIQRSHRWVLRLRQSRFQQVAACLIVLALVAAPFLPFVPIGYDPLARPLAGMAWGLGRAGLLLVPIGGLWLWGCRQCWLHHNAAPSAAALEALPLPKLMPRTRSPQQVINGTPAVGETRCSRGRWCRRRGCSRRPRPRASRRRIFHAGRR
jgi:hypothetical protein